MRHLRGIEAFRATNPKTGERFLVTGVEQRLNVVSTFRRYSLKARPESAPLGKQYGAVTLVNDPTDYPSPQAGLCRIHSYVEEDYRSVGIGALLYITAAVFAGRRGAKGVWSAGGSPDARTLWNRLVKHNIATLEGSFGVWTYVLTARAARATKLVTYLGKYGRPSIAGESWG